MRIVPAAVRAAAARVSFESLESRQMLSGVDTDFGDAPDSYRTTLAVNGARHFATPNIHLGNVVDAEPDGQPAVGALRDDLSGPADDEDGIVFLTPIVPGSPATVQVTNGAGAGRMSAWLDFNLNGAFDPATEQIFTNVALPAASVTNHTFAVPTFAVPGDSYSRWRLNVAGGLTPVGPGDFGEVEDHAVRIEGATDLLDYGDAPDSYRTTIGVNGARHNATPNILLGNAIDVEPNGQPSVGATRDDTTGVPDDEDGIVFLNPIVPGAIVNVQVTTGAGGGRLNAWMDFNLNGAFDAAEQIFTNTPVPGAAVTVLNFVVPATALLGDSYSRFRLNFTGGLAPFGPGGFGEVEDYAVKIVPPSANMDFGDAPDTYRTTLAVNGARHTATPNLRLGNYVDVEPDGQPAPGALRDDLTGIPDDEDGIVFLDPISPGAANVRVQVHNGAGAGRLNAWMDFNGNGAFNAGEQIFTNVPLPAASFTIQTFNVPATALVGVSYSRFRLNQTGGLAPFGFGGFGEVEDYQNKIEQSRLDFGDAPDAVGTPFQYPTMLGGASGNPARHVVVANGPRLGPVIDTEPDGQQNLGANGDDVNGAPDDEDGVTVAGTPFENYVLVPGTNAPIQISNPGANGLLNAWFDWNRDGDWNDPGEQVATSVPAPAGVTNLAVPVPNTVPANVQIYSRFRINTTGALAPTGLAQNGEVEDYVNRTAQPPGNLDFGDAPESPTGALLYPTTLAGPPGNGARHVIFAAAPRLGQRVDPEPDGQPTALANGDDLSVLFPGVDDEDGVLNSAGMPWENQPIVPGMPTFARVTNGGAVNGLLNAWFDWNQNGQWGAGEQVAVNIPIAAGATINLPINPPAGMQPTFVYSRFRISTQPGLTPAGIAENGEVEDYRNRVLVDTVPPRTTGGALEFETFQGVTVLFNEPLDPATVSASDMTGLNLDTNQNVAANSVLLSANNMSATWVFNTPGTFVPDGDYEFKLAANSVEDEAGNGLAGNFDLSGPTVFFLAGDATRDRTVNLNDFNTMAANFGLAGMTFSQGNFDYDAAGNVNLNDFNILVSRFGMSVAPAGATGASSSSSSSSSSPRRRASRPLATVGLPGRMTPTRFATCWHSRAARPSQLADRWPCSRQAGERSQRSPPAFARATLTAEAAAHTSSLSNVPKIGTALTALNYYPRPVPKIGTTRTTLSYLRMDVVGRVVARSSAARHRAASSGRLVRSQSATSAASTSRMRGCED